MTGHSHEQLTVGVSLEDNAERRLQLVLAGYVFLARKLVSDSWKQLPMASVTLEAIIVLLA